MSAMQLPTACSSCPPSSSLQLQHSVLLPGLRVQRPASSCSSNKRSSYHAAGAPTLLRGWTSSRVLQIPLLCPPAQQSSRTAHHIGAAPSDGGAGGGRGSSNGGFRGFGGGSSSGDGSDHSGLSVAAATALAACSLLISLLSAGAAAAAAAASPAAQQQDTQQQQQQQHSEPQAAATQQPSDAHEQQPSEQQQASLQHQAPAEGVSVQPSQQDPDPQGGVAGDNEPHAATAAAAAAEEHPKRIVLFIEPSPFTYMSGYQTRFLATIQELQALGCEVLVVTPGRGAAGLLPGGQQQPSEFAGAKVVEAGSFPCPGYDSVPLSLGLSPRIYNEVAAWKPDVIHVTSPGALPIAAWLYSRILRVPLVASYHTHVPSYLPRLGLDWLSGGVWGIIRAIHKAAHLTIAVSPKTATDLVDAGACDSKTVRVWPKAVDCDRFHPQRASPSMRARLAGGSSNARQPLLLYVGRVSPEKNVQLLLSVLQQLPGARLAIVGDGPALGDMKALFKDTPTVFTGKLTGLDLAAAYASADVFVMPSETETLGNVVGEAMASGLPVVAAAAGGVPSFISRPGETGFLFPPGDATSAAAQVKSLLSSRAARHRMSESARAEMQRFSWRSATQEILKAHYPAAMLANKAEQQRSQEFWPLSVVPLPPTAA